MFRAFALAAIAAVSLSLPLLQGVDEKSPAMLDREEARKAFEYLNKVRAAPGDFSKEIGADLKDVKARPALKWNDALTKAAEAKALDMATRDYYSHTTPEGRGMNIAIHEAGYKLPDFWLKDKQDNYFESIHASPPDGLSTIRGMILDKGIEELGHRKHLLGMDEFRAKHKDIGIGFARNPQSKWKTYISVVIAHPE